MIRLIGYWKVMLDDDYPLPQELETTYEPAIRAQLIAHLEAGHFHQQYRGTSWCRFGCEDAQNNGSSELSDGVWVWPEGLSHYLRRHSVALPPDFVRHATSAKLHEPPSGDQERFRDEVDDTDWIEWARPYRTPAMAALLVEAKQAAIRAYQEKVAAWAVELAARHGVGEGPCAWAGCSGRNLVGKAICANHAAENERWILPRAEIEELQRIVRKLPDLRATSI